MAESKNIAQRPGGRRDSILVMGAITAVGETAPQHQIRVRNLSASGLMADVQPEYGQGDAVEIELRGVGVVAGEIMWIRDNRMGVAFTRTIDPDLVRKPVGTAKARDVRKWVGNVDKEVRRPGLRIL